MDKKSSVLYGLEEKQEQMLAVIQLSLDNTLKKLEEDFKRQRKTLIEDSNRISDDEMARFIKNSLAEKKLEIRHKTNLKKLELIKDILATTQGSLTRISKEDYNNFFRRSLEELTHKYTTTKDPVIIHVLFNDIPLVNLNSRKISILDNLDPNSLGGYLIEIPNKKIVINNTLEERFENSRRNLQKELGLMLFDFLPQPKWDEDRIINNLMNK